ncbi:hypothetical protein R3398_17165 [Rossellomorea marisflavi]|uniref:hypothetical protein n=1 Tax=Rossellomorea marisflavi TaxID=189381 RepID=UPI00296EF4A4|nr:hypothetical protein [Rossellomorea marisflavi]MDW4528099.1 hypothetical protein [Rossellomorea marisflavi]
MTKERVLFLIIFLLPLGVNALMFIPLGALVSENIIWIGFFGSYLGGIVSGLLTLRGVRLTIEENQKKSLMESLPEKLMYLEEIIFILERQKKLLIKNFKEEDAPSKLNPRYRDRIKYTLEYLEEGGLLKNSAKVNVITYRSTRKLFNYLKEINYNRSALPLPYKRINDSYETAIKSLKIECEKYLNEIEK